MDRSTAGILRTQAYRGAMSHTTSKKSCDKMASGAMGLKVEGLKVQSRRTAHSELTFDL